VKAGTKAEGIRHRGTKAEGIRENEKELDNIGQGAYTTGA